ncbi:hypothetical protein H4218_003118 [Coemansia sp. IMI 209128]|nr:hypothetical protein H4218_003118 [Coemansia sp. IMI 209128]
MASSTQRISSDANNGNTSDSGAASRKPQQLQLPPHQALPSFQQHRSDQYLQSQLPTSELAALSVNGAPLASAPATFHQPSAYPQPAGQPPGQQQQQYGGYYAAGGVGNAGLGAEVDNGFDEDVGYNHYQNQGQVRGGLVSGSQAGQRLSDVGSSYAAASQYNPTPGSSGASSVDGDSSSSGNALPQPRKPGIGLHQFASQPKLNSLSDGPGAGDFAIPRPRPRTRPGRSSLAPESSLNGAEPNPFLTYSRNSIYSSSQTSLSRGSMYGLNSTANMTSKRMSRTLVSGNNALDMYREAAKKTQDENIQLEYAKFLIQSIENLADPVVREDVNVTYSVYFPGGGSGGGMSDPMLSPGFGLGSASNSTASLPLGQQASDIDPENREKLVTEAVYWIKHLQRKGNTEASYIAGTWFDTGCYGIETDKSKAIQLFTYAAKNHHAAAAYKVGQYQEERKSSGRAFSYYQMAAALGDVSANYRMARVYLDGDFGKKVNIKQAIVFLRRSAELASAECHEGAYLLATMYLGEHLNHAVYEVVFFDAEEAQKLLDKAARLGSAEAQFKLGRLFELGEHGFPVDPRLSTYYYQQAAEQDHAEAQMSLSGWYVSGGEGVEINDQLAFDWGHRAAQQGFTRAIFAMGYYYEMGVGCEPDINQANEWYARAAAAGSVEAKERLNRGNATNSLESTAALRRHVTQKRQKDSSSGRGRKRGGLLSRDKDKEKDKDNDKDKDGTSCIVM